MVTTCTHVKVMMIRVFAASLSPIVFFSSCPAFAFTTHSLYHSHLITHTLQTHARTHAQNQKTKKKQSKKENLLSLSQTSKKRWEKAHISETCQLQMKQLDFLLLSFLFRFEMVQARVTSLPPLHSLPRFPLAVGPFSFCTQTLQRPP